MKKRRNNSKTQVAALKAKLNEQQAILDEYKKKQEQKEKRIANFDLKYDIKYSKEDLDTTITIRVNKAVLQEFQAICKKVDLKYTSVLKFVMREFIANRFAMFSRYNTDI